MDAGEPVYYLISDLHIGGDEQLEHVEFLDELLGFLSRLEPTDEDAELIINGDAFGLREFTLLPGNHDHGLAAYDAYAERFAAYNVEVVQAESIDRVIDETTVHFEHGHQHDPNNRIENWGDPNRRRLATTTTRSLPVGPGNCPIVGGTIG
jgi:metallophosphoesterase superfamily enzyme